MLIFDLLPQNGDLIHVVIDLFVTPMNHVFLMVN